MNMTPCYQCCDRQLGCHGNCQKYIDFRIKKDEAIRVRRAENDVTGFLVDQVTKNTCSSYRHRRR